MNLWNKNGVPHKGWKFVNITDIRDSGTKYTECMMCGTQIRWVHWMVHEDYPEELGVGCVCAEKMESNYVAPRRRERLFINRLNRKKRWLIRKWRISSSGNPFLNINGNNIVVFQNNSGKWGYRIVYFNDEVPSKRGGFNTENEAKLAAFDELFL